MNGLLLSLILVGISICIAAGIIVITSDRRKVKKDQIWMMTHHSDNPFKMTSSNTYLVLDVKDGYVRYQDTVSGIIKSDIIKWFLLGAELKK